MTADRSFESVETNGVRLRVVVEGEGPLAILLHGWPQCWYLWRNQIDPIKEAGFRVAVPDQRGIGGSDCPPGVEDYNIPELCKDVVGLVDALAEEGLASDEAKVITGVALPVDGGTTVALG